MTPDAAEAALLAHWRATARTGRRQRGRQWYPTMREWANHLANETGHTVEQVVAVLAITSPGIQLKTNMKHTARIMRGEAETGGRFPNVNRPKVQGVLASAEAAHAYVTGPKVGPFHRAILGDHDALVLDRWAVFAATGNAEHREGFPAKIRAAVEQAYRSLARKLRVTVRELQATIWLHVRETTAHGRTGTVHKLADITA